MGNGHTNGNPATTGTAFVAQDEVEVHTNGTVHGYVSGADICPECKMVTLVRVEGCEKCLTCGYSRC